MIGNTKLFKMKKEDFKIVFMGTPEFAVEILDALYHENYTITGVVTAADKPAGRGQKLQMSAVKQYALEKKLNILQPAKLKDETFITALKGYQADLFVVVAFRMLPEEVWRIPQKGTINLHASLLPNYRGAAPINWAIINGENKTGVTTFFIDKEIDTGTIIDQREIEIDPNETAGELHDKLKVLGAQLTASTVKIIMENSYQTKKQQTLITGKEFHAPKIFRQDCSINWKQPAKKVHDFIRGLSPYPGAHALWKDSSGNERMVKIYKTGLSDQKILNDSQLKSDTESILVPCSDTYLRIFSLQPEGKRKMDAKEFMAGHSIEGYILT